MSADPHCTTRTGQEPCAPTDVRPAPSGLRRPALLVALLLTIAAAPARPAADPDAALARCAALDADGERLACYDALAGRPAAPAPDPAQRFGSEMLPAPEHSDAPRTATVDSLGAVLVGLTRRPHGEYVFELDNGQRWTELEPGRARFRRGQTVQIARTTLGAYMLSAPSGRATRVRRLE